MGHPSHGIGTLQPQYAISTNMAENSRGGLGHSFQAIKPRPTRLDRQGLLHCSVFCPLLHC